MELSLIQFDHTCAIIARCCSIHTNIIIIYNMSRSTLKTLSTVLAAAGLLLPRTHMHCTVLIFSYVDTYCDNVYTT